MQGDFKKVRVLGFHFLLNFPSSFWEGMICPRQFDLSYLLDTWLLNHVI